MLVLKLVLALGSLITGASALAEQKFCANMTKTPLLFPDSTFEKGKSKVEIYNTGLFLNCPDSHKQTDPPGPNCIELHMDYGSDNMPTKWCVRDKADGTCRELPKKCNPDPGDAAPVVVTSKKKGKETEVTGCLYLRCFEPDPKLPSNPTKPCTVVLKEAGGTFKDGEWDNRTFPEVNTGTEVEFTTFKDSYFRKVLRAEAHRGIGPISRFERVQYKGDGAGDKTEFTTPKPKEDDKKAKLEGSADLISRDCDSTVKSNSTSGRDPKPQKAQEEPAPAEKSE